MNAVVYIHGRKGSPNEANHYISLFKGYDVLGFDYKELFPWTVKEEFSDYFNKINNKYKDKILIANSMGAYLAMNLLDGRDFLKTFFISPLIDPYKVCLRFMKATGITEDIIKEKKEIRLINGDIFTPRCIEYYKNKNVNWTSNAVVIYGTKDCYIDEETVVDFVEKNKIKLYSLKGGEHWFHTKEQMDFIDDCIRKEFLNKY